MFPSFFVSIVKEGAKVRAHIGKGRFSTQHGETLSSLYWFFVQKKKKKKKGW